MWIPKQELAVGLPLHREPALVHQAVMPPAELDEVLRGGLPSLGPVLDVVILDPAAVRTTWEPAAAVAFIQGAPHTSRDRSALASDAPRPIQTVGHRDPRGIAGEPPCRLRGDRCSV